ncbi:MAG: PIN domain-containing protein [Patescibacteria group bacterium]
MIFVDTNFFVRFLLKDNDQQYLIAKKLFEEAAQKKIRLTTSLVVFFEIVWVLRSSYGKDRQALADSLYKILKLDFELAERKLLIESLNIFQKTALSFEDCYNLVFAKIRGIKEFKTFDAKLNREFEKL